MQMQDYIKLDFTPLNGASRVDIIGEIKFNQLNYFPASYL